MHDTKDQTFLGIALILMSVLAMAFADAVVKWVSGDVTLWQVFVIRSLFAIPVLLVMLRALGTPLALRAPGWVVLRSALLVVTWILFYSALPVLSLSVAAVAVYTNPIFTALLSAALLGERVAPRQWLGVCLGFAGVLAILRPGTEAFSWAVLLPLLAALLYSAAMILTRSKCRSETPLVLGLALHATFLATGALAIGLLTLLHLAPTTTGHFPFLLDRWAELNFRSWALLGFIGVLSAAYFVGVARAYQIAPPHIIGTFDYAYLISAALWGFLLFAETPDAFTLAGMALITAAGVLVATGRKQA